MILREKITIFLYLSRFCIKMILERRYYNFSRFERRIKGRFCEKSESLPITAADIANFNTGKFHRIGGSAVKNMAEHNKVSCATREECIAAGYVGCKICNPEI